MRSSIVAFLLLAAASQPLRAGVVADEVLRAAERGERVPVIVALRSPAAEGKSGAAATVAIRSVEARVLARLDAASFRLRDRWDSVAGFAGELSIGAVSALANDADVLRVDLDAGGSAHLAESVALVGGTAVHALGFSGEGVTIAVVDSGIDATHPDLAGAVVDEHCFCRGRNGAGCCPDGSTMQSGPGAGEDGAGHGTAVAGTLASRGHVAAPGMAPKAKLVAVRVLDDDNRFAFDSQIVTALDYLLTDHPEVRVVNLSLGTDALYADACDRGSADQLLWSRQLAAFRARGTAVVVSSGNEASANAMAAPACVSGAWAVAATYDVSLPFAQDGACAAGNIRADDLACFSNSSPQLAFVAPGAFITTSVAHGGAREFVGTSFAAPHVAGAAAVLFAMKPSATVEEIETLLRRTGKVVIDPRTGRATPRIDLLEAVKDLEKTMPPAGPRRRAARH